MLYIHISTLDWSRIGVYQRFDLVACFSFYQPLGHYPNQSQPVNCCLFRSLTNTVLVNLQMSPSDGEHTRSNYMTNSSTTRYTTGALNVILFGETGVGKSSVINLLAGQPIAKVSSDVEGCTLQSTKYTFTLMGSEIRIWDTVGLEEPTMGVNGYLAAIEKAHALIRDLAIAGGVDLLLFCIRGSRITATTQSNYRLFHEVLCNKEVPIALVVTNLEREVEMEDWWTRNEEHIKMYGIHSIGHACVTGVEEEVEKYEKSKETLRKLLLSQLNNRRRFSMPTESWLARLLAGLGNLLHSKSPPKGEKMVRTLVKRCNMDGETAKRLATLLT